MIKKNVLVLLICLLTNFVFAQKLSIYLADKEFDQYNYLKAVEYYSNALQKDSLNDHVLRRLGQAYHKMGKLNASENYLDLLANNPKHSPSDRLLLAEVLRESGKYSLAKKSYQQYLAYAPQNKEVQKLIQQMESLEKVNLIQLNCSVKNLDINSSYSDFAPAMYKDKLIFSSGRKAKRFRADRYGWNGQYFLELFEAKHDSSMTFNSPERFAKAIGSKYHEGVLCFSKDYQTMFFTRSNFYHGKLSRDKDGVSNLKLFVAENKNERWQITGEFIYNSDDYSVGHPCLSEDGKTLYFVSDMPGGFGGTDIYKSELVNNKWSKPINLGKKINSSDNEMFPHLSSDLLFFASNGRGGLGGLDLYFVDLSVKNGEIQHPGVPLNSNADDFALVYDDAEGIGYFSSNRTDGKGGDDIYQFKLKQNPVQFLIKNSETEELILADQILVDGVMDKNLIVDTDKKVYTKSIDREKKYQLHISKDGFTEVDTVLYSRLFDNNLSQVYYLTPIPPVEEVLVERKIDSIPPIYFDFDKYEITAQASEILTNVLNVLNENKTCNLVIVANTDVRGSIEYNQLLAEKRALSTKDYLQKNGVSSQRLSILINGELKPLRHSENQSMELWHGLNRRVDFKLKSIEK